MKGYLEWPFNIRISIAVAIFIVLVIIVTYYQIPHDQYTVNADEGCFDYKSANLIVVKVADNQHFCYPEIDSLLKNGFHIRAADNYRMYLEPIK